MYSDYKRGMLMFPPTGSEALKDEFQELVTDKSLPNVNLAIAERKGSKVLEGTRTP
jgi:hypothetical protein